MSQHTALNEQQQNKLVNKVSAIRFNLGIGNFDEAKQRAFSAEQSLIEEGMSPFGIITFYEHIPMDFANIGDFDTAAKLLNSCLAFLDNNKTFFEDAFYSRIRELAENARENMVMQMKRVTGMGFLYIDITDKDTDSNQYQVLFKGVSVGIVIKQDDIWFVLRPGSNTYEAKKFLHKADAAKHLAELAKLD
ncbi:MAG: hypothetical protein V7K25_15130 [Nostoc sp.]|uniref:hypothetical protein n=1 Tax=Nostoc sp. TaxID=1180 RepID=UPI002FFB2D63